MEQSSKLLEGLIITCAIETSTLATTVAMLRSGSTEPVLRATHVLPNRRLASNTTTTYIEFFLALCTCNRTLRWPLRWWLTPSSPRFLGRPLGRPLGGWFGKRIIMKRGILRRVQRGIQRRLRG